MIHDHTGICEYFQTLVMQLWWQCIIKPCIYIFLWFIAWIPWSITFGERSVETQQALDHDGLWMMIVVMFIVEGFICFYVYTNNYHSWFKQTLLYRYIAARKKKWCPIGKFK